MTVSSTNSRNDYQASGSCNFPYTFEITEATALQVYLCDALVTSGYTVSGVGSTTGGTVTFTPTPATGVNVTLLRNESFTQGLDLVNHGPFDADSLEDTQDKHTFLDQQLLEMIGRAPKFPAFSFTCNVTMPTPNPGTFLRWASCTALDNGCVVSSGSLSVPATFTAGSVVFAINAAALGQDNANLYWDDTNNRLGIGTNTPLTGIHERTCGADILLPTASQINHVRHYINPISFGSTQSVALAVETCGVSTGGATAGRIAGYFGASTGGSGTGPNAGNPLWALNAVVEQRANDAEAKLIGFELDVANNRSHGNTSGNCQVGFSSVSSGSKIASLAFTAAGTGLWCVGFDVAQNGLSDHGYAFRYHGNGQIGPAVITEDSRLQLGFESRAGSGGEVHVRNNALLRGLNAACTSLIPFIGVTTCNRITIDRDANGVQFGCGTVAASVPGNFAANRILFFRDGAGNVFAVPGMTTAW